VHKNLPAALFPAPSIIYPSFPQDLNCKPSVLNGPWLFLPKPAMTSPSSPNSVALTPNAKHDASPQQPASSTPHDHHMNGSGASSSDSALPSSKKKQKRNKPTLSCGECVERKTKVCHHSPVPGAYLRSSTGLSTSPNRPHPPAFLSLF
jgi:hypothetical protein